MVISIILLILDQISKYFIYLIKPNIELIPNLLSISYVENTGIAFGIFNNINIGIIYIISFLGIAVTLYLLKTEKDLAKRNYIYVILAGGIGNIIDRIFRGFVIDFIDTPFIATFNLADSFIVIGVIIYIILSIKNNNIIYKEKNKRKE